MTKSEVAEGMAVRHTFRHGTGYGEGVIVATDGVRASAVVRVRFADDRIRPCFVGDLTREG